MATKDPIRAHDHYLEAMWDCAADYWAAQAAGDHENYVYPDGWDDACWVITPEDSARKEQCPSGKMESATAHYHDINNKKAR